MNVKSVLDVFSPDTRLKYFRLWLVVGVLLIIGVNFWSLTSSLWLPMPGHTDKLYHIVSYALLMFWWLQLFTSRLVRVVIAIVFIGMGVGLEFLQSFHPMRYLDFKDMLANSIGVMITFVLGFTRLDQLLYRAEQKLVKT